jgi:site-specific recombinase XerD
MSSHTSRHTCATLLVHQGVAITTVQKLLGHTSVKTTQIYSEVLSSTIVRDLKNVQRKKVKMFPDKGLRTSDFIDNR